jgi:16S rRNA (uracil1498-N3)-methyltransferase
MLPTSPLLKAPLPRVFLHHVPLAVGSPLSLRGAEHHYLTRVLRLTLGDQVLILDGNGAVAAAQVTAIDAQTLSLEPQAIEHAAHAGGLPPLHLLVGILKGERHDWLIEKATELGATRILSLSCARSVPSLSGDRGDKRQARWLRVAQAAASQCRRPQVPQISAPLPFREGLAQCASGLRLLFSEGIAPPLRRVLSADADSPMSSEPWPAVSLLVGPEGGLTDEEQAEALAAGFQVCSLGANILRAETAALAALSATAALLQQ